MGFQLPTSTGEFSGFLNHPTVTVHPKTVTGLGLGGPTVGVGVTP